MRPVGRHAVLLACLLLLAGALAGCSNPDAPSAATSQPAGTPASPGEPSTPRPATPARQSPIDVQHTPQAALSRFAETYINWTYRTLAADQKHLAAISVGQARLSEQQAAASSKSDLPLQRGHVWNHGRVVSIARDRQRTGWWVVVTLERTGGSGEYAGLPAAFHVTLARLARLNHGYAVETWSPQT